jgi:hypothetical protein
LIDDDRLQLPVRPDVGDERIKIHAVDQGEEIRKRGEIPLSFSPRPWPPVGRHISIQDERGIQ